MKRVVSILAVTLGFAGAFARPAAAGPYADELTKCLAWSATDAEKATLVKWMFAAAALHPELRGMSSVTAEQREELSKATGKVFQRLLTEACLPELQDAVEFEGEESLRASSQVIGQLGSLALFSEPNVATFMSDFFRFMDATKIQESLRPK